MDFYLIRSRKNSVILYTETEQLSPQTHPDPISDSPNLVDRFIARLSTKKGRLAGFLKKLIVLIRDTYYKLEHKIDPMEQVFKRLRHASHLNLFYSPGLSEAEASEKFEALLIRQKNKHTFWAGVDFIISIFTFFLSPILIPLPGPNLFLYYPALRTVSHYLARRGARHGLTVKERRLAPLPLISDIEVVLNQRGSSREFARIHHLAQQLKLEHLHHFLERYSG